MGIPEFEARQYEGKVKSGSSLISIHSVDSDETARIKDIFERCGADDITCSGEIAVDDSDNLADTDVPSRDERRSGMATPPRI